jgi:hypothetical protein
MLGAALILQLRGRCAGGGGARLRVLKGGAVAQEPVATDPWVFQAQCVEAFVASWHARGFSPVTIDNGSGEHPRRILR